MESNTRAIKATETGAFKDEILPYEVKETFYDPATKGLATRSKLIEKDEGPRPSTMESVGRLRTVFSAKGSVTAANSSQMSDGAAAVLVVSKKVVDELGLNPLARFVRIYRGGRARRRDGHRPQGSDSPGAEADGTHRGPDGLDRAE